MQTTDGASRPSHLSLLSCLLICMAAPLSGLAQSGLSPILPVMTGHFADEPNAALLVRAMVSGLSATMIIGSLVGGFIAERIGQIRLLAVSLGFFALAGAIGYWLDNLYLMVASRMVLGIVNAMAGLMAAAIITTRIAPEMRDRWMGFYVVTGTVGAMVMLMIVGELGKIDWRLVFPLHFVALPIAVLVFLAIPEMPELRGNVGARLPAAAGIPWGLTLFGVLCGAVISSTMIYLPFHLHDQGHGASDKVALALLVSAGTGGISAFFFGTIRRYFSVLQIFVAGYLCCGLALLTVIATGDFNVILPAMAFQGVGAGVLTPNLFSAIAASVPAELRSRTLGFTRAGFYAGPLVAQVFLEPVSQGFGAISSMALIGVTSIMAAGMSVVGRRKFAPAT